MASVWIPCDKYLPDKDGIYLVTTSNGKIRMDRFSNGAWGLCMPRHNNRGRYKPHIAWTHLPKPYKAN